jgi:hypothetical protein
MDEKEILRARLQAAPRSVFLSVKFSGALAILMTTRILWTYQQAGKPLSRGLFYAGLVALMLIANGISLLNKSKMGYVVVLVFGALPALGSFALAVHAFTMVFVGSRAEDQIGLVTSLIGSLQFVTIVALLTTLLRREAREWVWKDVVEVPAA